MTERVPSEAETHQMLGEVRKITALLFSLITPLMNHFGPMAVTNAVGSLLATLLNGGKQSGSLTDEAISRFMEAARQTAITGEAHTGTLMDEARH